MPPAASRPIFFPKTTSPRLRKTVCDLKMVRALFIVVLSAGLARGENELQHELHAVLGEKSGNVLEN